LLLGSGVFMLQMVCDVEIILTIYNYGNSGLVPPHSILL
jgi:hypothetical protein